MRTFVSNTRGLTLLLSINWDRILYLVMIIAFLGAGGWVGRL